VSVNQNNIVSNSFLFFPICFCIRKKILSALPFYLQFVEKFALADEKIAGRAIARHFFVCFARVIFHKKNSLPEFMINFFAMFYKSAKN